MFHEKFVIRDGFDGYPGAMPVVVVALAVGGAGHAAFAKRCHFNARKDKPVRVGHGYNFRKPRVEQRFGVLAGRFDLSTLALLDRFKIPSDRDQRQGRVGKQLLDRGSMRAKADIGRVFKDFESWRHLLNSTSIG